MPASAEHERNLDAWMRTVDAARYTPPAPEDAVMESKVVDFMFTTEDVADSPPANPALVDVKVVDVRVRVEDFAAIAPAYPALHASSEVF